MATDDDGHGPSYGCTYQSCGHPNAPTLCPFVKDGKPDRDRLDALAHNIRAAECQHEWRFMYPDSSVVDRFYCIYCLVVRTKNDARA